MAEAPSQPPPSVPSAERVNDAAALRVVNADISCIHCNYDLRGINTSGTCPECGTPVKHSLGNTFLLKYASPEYIARLYWGSILVLASWVWDILNSFVAVYWNVVGELPALTYQSRAYVGSVFDFAYFTGWWLLSSRGAPSQGRGPMGTGHRFVRWLVLCGFFGSLIRLAAQAPGVESSLLAGMGQDQLIQFIRLSQGVYIAGSVGMIVVFSKHLATIGSHIPSRRIVTWSIALRWIVPLLLIGCRLALWGPFPRVVNNLFSIALQIVSCSLCFVLVFWLYADLRRIREGKRTEFN